jgi:hypothetical protein
MYVSKLLNNIAVDQKCRPQQSCLDTLVSDIRSN